jgi:hypothetical protein
MLLLPLLILAVTGLAIYLVVHRRAQVAAGAASPPLGALPEPAPFWPATVLGKVGVGAFALSFLLMALVNVVQVYLLRPAVLLVAVVLTGLARFTRRDRSTAVLITFVVCGLAVLAGALFLAGEILIGHD